MTHATLTANAEMAAVPASTEERVRSLDEFKETIDWDPFVRRCLGYSRCRLSRHGASVARFGQQAGDFVQDAIELTFEGRRRFTEGTPSEFFLHICGVIDSLISHAAAKSRRRGTAVTITNEVNDDAVSEQLTEDRIASPDNLELGLLFRDDLERFFQWIEPELAAYARLRAEDGDSTAREYALVLGVAEADIRNMDRRLRRRREQWTNHATATNHSALMM